MIVDVCIWSGLVLLISWILYGVDFSFSNFGEKGGFGEQSLEPLPISEFVKIY